MADHYAFIAEETTIHLNAFPNSISKHNNYRYIHTEPNH